MVDKMQLDQQTEVTKGATTSAGRYRQPIAVPTQNLPLYTPTIQERNEHFTTELS